MLDHMLVRALTLQDQDLGERESKTEANNQTQTGKQKQSTSQNAQTQSQAGNGKGKYGYAAVGAVGDEYTGVSLLLSSELKKACCGSEVLYWYAQELLVFLEGGLGATGETVLASRARRLRQELESAAVFEGDDKREGSSKKLRNAAAFGLKLGGLYGDDLQQKEGVSVGVGVGAGAGMSVKQELYASLKEGGISETVAGRLLTAYLGTNGDADADADSDSGLLSADNLRNLNAPLFYLRHAQIMKYLIKGLMNPEKAKGAFRGRYAKLLALCCACDDTQTDLSVLHWNSISEENKNKSVNSVSLGGQQQQAIPSSAAQSIAAVALATALESIAGKFEF